MDRVMLSVPAEPAFFGTLRLVVGGVASRSGLSYEQVNEFQLAVESLVSHRTAAGDVFVIDADVDDRSLSIAIGPFVREEDERGRRVAERLVASVRTVGRDDGSDWVELQAGRRPEARTGERGS